jgi:hypothetical protein
LFAQETRENGLGIGAVDDSEDVVVKYDYLGVWNKIIG